MMDEHPDSQGQQGLPQQGKIILPGQPNTPYPPAVRAQRPYGNGTPRLSNRSALSKPIPPPPFTKKGSFWTSWRSDPSYKILALALGVVLIIGIIFAIILGNVFASIFHPGGGTVTSGPTGPAPQSTSVLNSTLPTPTVNQGNAPNTPPAVTPTPIIQPTATPFPTPTTAPTSTPTTPPTPIPTPTPNQGSPFTLQITSIPGTVHNYSVVPVHVAVSQGGVKVKLVISYNAPPGSATVSPQKTDDSGHATLYWLVLVSQVGHTPVTAQVTAIAYTQDGQQVASPTIPVQIQNFGIGG